MSIVLLALFAFAAAEAKFSFSADPSNAIGSILNKTGLSGLNTNFDKTDLRFNSSKIDELRNKTKDLIDKTDLRFNSSKVDELRNRTQEAFDKILNKTKGDFENFPAKINATHIEAIRNKTQSSLDDFLRKAKGAIDDLFNMLNKSQSGSRPPRSSQPARNDRPSSLTKPPSPSPSAVISNRRSVFSLGNLFPSNKTKSSINKTDLHFNVSKLNDIRNRTQEALDKILNKTKGDFENFPAKINATRLREIKDQTNGDIQSLVKKARDEIDGLFNHSKESSLSQPPRPNRRMYLAKPPKADGARPPQVAKPPKP